MRSKTLGCLCLLMGTLHLHAVSSNARPETTSTLCELLVREFPAGSRFALEPKQPPIDGLSRTSEWQLPSEYIEYQEEPRDVAVLFLPIESTNPALIPELVRRSLKATSFEGRLRELRTMRYSSLHIRGVAEKMYAFFVEKYELFSNPHGETATAIAKTLGMTPDRYSAFRTSLRPETFAKLLREALSGRQGLTQDFYDRPFICRVLDCSVTDPRVSLIPSTKGFDLVQMNATQDQRDVLGAGIVHAAIYYELDKQNRATERGARDLLLEAAASPTLLAGYVKNIVGHLLLYKAGMDLLSEERPNIPEYVRSAMERLAWDPEVRLAPIVAATLILSAPQKTISRVLANQVHFHPNRIEDAVWFGKDHAVENARDKLRDSNGGIENYFKRFINRPEFTRDKMQFTRFMQSSFDLLAETKTNERQIFVAGSMRELFIHALSDTTEKLALADAFAASFEFVPMVHHSGEMQRTVVTQGQFAALMGENPSHSLKKVTTIRGVAADLDRPLDYLSARDAERFMAKLSELDPMYDYRLPTLREWQTMSSADTAGYFHFEGDPSQLGHYAWVLSNSDSQTHPVGTKRPNALGLYDVYGNVSQWVVGVAPGTFALVGGDYISRAEQANSRVSVLANPEERAVMSGFRLVRVPKRADTSDAKR